MPNQGSGLHSLFKGMLIKQEETETNTARLAHGGQPAHTESSKATSVCTERREQQGLTTLALIRIKTKIQLA